MTEARPAAPTARGQVAMPPPASPATLPGLLLTRAADSPDRVALRSKTLGRWAQTTYGEYASRVASVGLGLVELGVGLGDRVAIHSDNRAEWLFADLGTQGIGAVTVGVYPTSSAAEVEYLLAHSESKVVIVEDQEQLDKTLAVRDRLPALRHIVIVDPTGLRGFSDPQVMTFDELERMGAEVGAGRFAERVASLVPDSVAIIVYTSGTTGPPKGAMLTHANLLAAARGWDGSFALTKEDETLSYLPLCHAAERLLSVVLALHAGYVVNFPEGPSTMAEDIVEIQPTFFLGVPRVWEKIMAHTESRAADATRLKRAVYRFWMAQGRRMAERRLAGKGSFSPWYLLGWLMLYRKLRQSAGLGRARLAACGAAPIAPEVLRWFWSIGVPVREGYGQTEGSGLATFNPPSAVRIGTVGLPVTGAEVRIAADGEILVRSPGVFAGYLKDEAATTAKVDAEGWLHSGDVGHFDDAGYLVITDRKNDMYAANRL